MFDPGTLAGLGAAKVLIETVLVPLTKDVAKDFYKDFLKNSASKALYEQMPELFRKAILHSQKDFLVLFQEELEYHGWPKQMATRHELAEPLKTFLGDAEVAAFLGEAFDFEVKRLDGDFLREKWVALGDATLPQEFDWEQLTKNYLRKVKGLIREDEALSRQLELDYSARVKANTDELVGVGVEFDLAKYQESLKERFGSLSLDSLDTTGAAYDNLRLWKIFVAQDVRECAEFAPQMYELPKERLLALQAAGEIDPLLSLDALEQQRRNYAGRPIESVRGVVGLKGAGSVLRCVILGDPGAGKSTLLRALALSWADRPLAELKGEPIPLLIELRLYAQDKERGICNDFLEYLHKGNTACRLNQLELDALLKDGKAVALFDGVDEVFDPKLREAVVTDIHRFSNRYEAVQMVVTSRWLGYKAEALRKAEFAHYMLQDLNDEQIEDFLERWHGLTFTKGQQAERERKQGRLQKAIGESKAIRELAGNPLLLTMMAILNRNQELPRDRALLYERASEVLLYQWDVEGKLHEQEDLKTYQIDVRDKQAILRKVAYHMQANEKGLSGNVIHREELEKIIIAYLKTLEISGGKARAISRIIIDQFRVRNFILCSLGADNYAFVHRTFLEYFCAREFVHQFEKERLLDKDDLKALYGEYYADEAWSEVLKLIAGIVDPRFVGEIIEHLLDQSIQTADFLEADFLKAEFLGVERLTVGGVSHLLLATGCLAEVRTRSEIVQVASLLLDKLKQQVEAEYPYRLSGDASKALLMSIAHNWKEDSVIKAWLEDFLSSEDPYASESAIQAIAQTWKEKTSTLVLLKESVRDSRNEYVRRTAVSELAKGWKEDPDTLPMLKERVREDENGAVRSTAVSELAKGWKEDPDTLPMLKERVREDENGDVRSTAVSELAKGWKEDPDTLPWLKIRVMEESDDDVCTKILNFIVTERKRNPEILDWLKTLAQESENWILRGAVIGVISENWKGNSDVSSWFQMLAKKSNNWVVRTAVIDSLASNRNSQYDVFETLRNRVKEDPSWVVRSSALHLLVTKWKDNSHTVSVLSECVKKDEDWAVVNIAEWGLAGAEESQLDSLPFQTRLAKESENSSVRSSMLRQIADIEKENSSLYEFWCDRTLKDPFERKHDFEDNPRQIALKVLVRQYPNHSKTTELLRDRAQNDADEKLRTWAAQQLSRLAPEAS